MSSALQATHRRLPIGVEIVRDGAHARVWAPKRKSVELVTYNGGGRVASITPLEPEESGYFSGFADELTAGTKYRFRLDRGDAFRILHHAFSPRARMGRRRSSIRRPSSGRIPT